MDILIHFSDGLLEFPFTNLGFAVFAGGIIAAYLMCLVLIALPLRRLWQRHAEVPWAESFTYWLLALDAIIYVTAIQIGQPAMIGLWLVLRVGGALKEKVSYRLTLAEAGTSLVVCVAIGIWLFSVLSTDWVR